jgi:hypothetical protein
VEEALLRKVVGLVERTAGQLAQEVPYLRLVAPDKFPEGGRVLGPDGQGNEVLVVAS